MKSTFTRAITFAAVLFAAPLATLAGNADEGGKKAAAAKSDDLATLEKKLLGQWRGPACGGNYTFNADGTYELHQFTPGNNNLTGTWSVRWDALPPTLVVTCKTSDFKTRAPDRAEYEHLDKAVEFKLVELNDKTLAYHTPDGKVEWRFARSREEGGSTKPIE